jgi:hypothetical protein
LTRYNHLTTSVGYACSSHSRRHFGRGKKKKAEVIEIRWPSGIVPTLRDVAGDRVLTAKQSPG